MKAKQFDLAEIYLTFDVDWAPDFVIEKVASELISRRIRSTWFITHPSPALELLRKHSDLFELGIHPNFSSNSTQGKTPEEILAYCMALVPEAKSMRTHSLVQSTPLIRQAMSETSILLDSSVYLPHFEAIRPFSFWWGGSELIKMPIFWEDDLEMDRPDGCWVLKDFNRFGPGLKIMDFHVIHIFMNNRTMNEYNGLRTKGPLNQLFFGDIPPAQTVLSGSGSLFYEIINEVYHNKLPLGRLRDFVDRRKRIK